MFPHHAWPGVAHHHAGLFAAIALVAMHGTVGARRLFPAKPAAFQPHAGVIQKLPAFSTQTFSRMMMFAAINPHHFRHRFPFPRQPPARRIIFCLRGGPNYPRAGGRFSSRSHVIMFARHRPAHFDASQLFDCFNSSEISGEMSRCLNSQGEAAPSVARPTLVMSSCRNTSSTLIIF